jgi:CBS domain-containing protein
MADRRTPASGEPLVAEVMQRRVVTIGPDATVQELAELLRKKKISGVPVVDDGEHVVGIVTEGDLVAQDADLHFPHYIQFLDSIIYLESVKKFEERVRKAVGAYVRDVMTKDVLTVSPQTTVREVATLMSDHKINRVPVVEDGKLVGIVTRDDVVRSMGL